MLNRAVELRPEDGFIVDSLGWAYFRLGEHEKAVTYLERAVELEPGDPVINDHLGDGYWKVGRKREARFQWQRALTFEPEPDVVTAIQAKLANGLSDAQPPPPAEAGIVERAPAKLNLDLILTGRRPDGYHELDSLVAFPTSATS